MTNSPERQQPPPSGDAPDGPEMTVPEESVPEPVEALLRRLEESVRAVPGSEPQGFTQIVTDAAGHADALRETLSAQQEAQELLAVAQSVRSAASSQAEKIVREARDAAERVHEESRRHAEQSRDATAAWAQEQRERVEKLIAELVESATRDADRIREEAVAAARAEAEQVGQQHIARATAQGVRDAEAIREEARQLLRQSTSVVSLATTSLQSLSGTVTEVSERLGVQVHAMQLLTRDAEQRLADQDPTPEEQVDLVEGEDEVDAAIADLLPVTEEDDPVGTRDEPTDEPTDDAVDGPGQAPAAPPSPGAHRGGRPLGSLFRGPETR